MKSRTMQHGFYSFAFKQSLINLGAAEITVFFPHVTDVHRFVICVANGIPANPYTDLDGLHYLS